MWCSRLQPKTQNPLDRVTGSQVRNLSVLRMIVGVRDSPFPLVTLVKRVPLSKFQSVDK